MNIFTRNFLLAAAAVLMLVPVGWSQDEKGGETAAPLPQPVKPQDQPAATAPAQSAQPQPPRGDSRSSVSSSKGWQPYRVIVDRNIFSRSRAPVGGTSGEDGESETTAAKQAEAAQGPPPEPGTQVVLIGVSFVGDYATAVFEDRRDGAIYAAQVGEKLVDRTIQSITLDSVQVDHESKTIEVVIGRTLAGGEPPEPKAAAGDSATPVDPATQSIIERLRAKREQELKK